MATSSEGKTSEDSAADSTVTDTPLCDACEDDMAVKYCIVCPGSLCDNCTKSHMKSKLTKDHTLCDISLSRLGSSYTRSGEAVDGLSKCLKHHDKELDNFCKNCSCFICVDCEADHNDHKILSARNDLSLYRSAYHENMKQMMDKVHDLEQYKITLEKTIQQYKETCDEVDEKAENLIHTIKENTKRLKEELHTVQGKLKQILGDAKGGLIKEIEDADKKVSQLRDLRKVEDCEVMSHGLASTRNDIDRLDDFKKKITSVAKTVSPKKVLPYRNEIAFIKDDVGIYFSTEYPFNPVIESYTSLKKERVLNANYPNEQHGYRFCKSPMGNSLIIHGKCKDNVHVLGDDFIGKRQIKSDINIWNLVKVYTNEYVAIHPSGSEEISLLDEKFDVIFTHREHKRVINAICYYTPHKYIVCETESKQTYLSIMLVKGKSFVKQSSVCIANIDKCYYMELCPDKEHVCMAGVLSKFIYKINISNSNFTKHDVSTSIPVNIWSLFVDGNSNILIGDSDGNVHKYDEQLNHEIIAKIVDSVRDVLVKDGRLLVSSKDNTIHVFS